MIRICAGIVTYNPQIDRLKENIEAVVPQVEQVLIYDNASENIADIGILAGEFDNVSIIKGNINNGIAKALNELFYEARSLDYSHIITLDQDSVCENNLVEALSKGIGDNVAIVSPKIVYRNNEHISTSDGNNFEIVDWVITSASLTSVKAWDDVGGFDENLFIDKVDYDFCVRLHRIGYNIIRANQVRLLHELGNLKTRCILGRTIYVTNHNNFRIYYMVRNSIYLKRNKNMGSPRVFVTKLLIKILLFEDDKVNKIKAIKKGIKDGRMM